MRSVSLTKCLQRNKRSHFAMNDIKIVTLSSSYSIMAEGVGCVVDSENGSFHSQITRRFAKRRPARD